MSLVREAKSNTLHNHTKKEQLSKYTPQNITSSTMMELCPSGPLYLELGNGIQAVLKRLSTSRETSSIKSLVLRGRYCRFIDTHVSPDEIHDVLRMASCLPNLKRLSLLRLRVPMSAITQTLRMQQQSLRELELRSVCLWGNQRECKELGHAVSQHATLTKISLADCRPEGGCDKLDAVLLGLSLMPALTRVELDMMELGRWLAHTESFRMLLGAKNLKRLSLSYMRLSDDYINLIAQALTNEDCPIEELFLDRCDSLGPSSVYAMATMLQHNTRLRALHLVLKNYQDSIPLANALHAARHASGLQTLLLRTYHHPRTVNPEVYQAFRRMLEENCVLTHLEMFQGHPIRPLLGEHWPVLQFFLHLNRAGRAKLMMGAPQASNEEWIRTIVGARQNLDCSFYFISQNPSVLSQQAA